MEKNGLHRRYNDIDIMEALSIFAVVLYHSCIIPHGILEDNNTRMTVITYINYFLISFLVTGVPVFFFCNGYLSFGRKLDLKKHCKKTIRYIIACVIWEIISAAVFLGLGIADAQDINWLYVLIGAYGYFAHFWFIKALICIYFVYPLLKMTYDHDKKSFYFFVLVCFIMTFGNKVIIFLVNVVHCFLDLPFAFDNYFGLMNPYRGIQGYTLVFFCMGGIARWFEEKYLDFIRANALKVQVLSAFVLFLSTALLFLWGIFFSNVRGDIWDVVAESYDTVFALVNTLCIYLFLLPYRETSNKVINCISANTLGIYYLHMFFVHMTAQFISNERVYNVAENILYGAIVLAMSLVVSIIIKKLPVVKKLL